MKIISSKLKSSDGITILEVLVAMALTAVVTLAIFHVYLTQHKQYLVQDDISEIQQNVRASVDELTRHVRMAGYDLPTGMPCILAANSNPDTITIRYRNNDCDTYLAAAMPQTSVELKCATDLSCFHDGDWVYIFEPDSGGGEWFQITQVQYASQHLQHNTMTLSEPYGKDAIITMLHEIVFYIDNTTDPEHPKLMVRLPGKSPYIFADNITDLQFQYRMKNDSLLNVPVLTENIREVLISVSGRSNQPDPDFPDSPYRVRSFATAVHLRNNEG